MTLGLPKTPNNTFKIYLVPSFVSTHSSIFVSIVSSTDMYNDQQKVYEEEKRSLNKRFLIWARESNVLHNTLSTLHYSSKLVKNWN